MSTSAAFDIATKLASQGFGAVGAVIGVNAFLNLGDNEIAVFEFPGRPDLATHGGVTQIEYPALQVQVRNVAQETARSTCDLIYKALRGQKDLTIGTSFYDYLEPKQLPAKLSVDEKERTIWYCEIQAHRRPQ